MKIYHSSICFPYQKGTARHYDLENGGGYGDGRGSSTSGWGSGHGDGNGNGYSHYNEHHTFKIENFENEGNGDECYPFHLIQYWE